MGIKDPTERRAYQKEYYKLNAEKLKQSSKQYRIDNKEAVKMCRARTSKKYRIEKEYNISIEEYYACMSTSDKCEICGTHNNLVYDHSHDSMKFRGVLCSRCNVGIGILGDNEEGLLKALEYIRRKL